MPVPSFDSSKPSPAFTAGQTLGIGKNTKAPDEAWKFIEFMLGPEAQLIFAQAGVLPVRAQVYEDPWFNTPLGKEMATWRGYIGDHGITFFPPEDYWKFCEILALTAQKVVSEPNLDIKEALDTAAEEYNQYHKEFQK
jgi:ABC-type glycerol-3-phosphate transport system substrate-binding protein